MILECPACSNRYLVDRRAIGAGGRVVRCAKCKHEWTAMPPRDENASKFEEKVELQPENPELAPIPEGSSVPVITAAPRKKPKGKVLALVASLLLLFCVSAVYFRPLVIAFLPASGKVYSLLGMYDTQGVVMTDLAYNKEAVRLKDLHHIEGYVVNTTQSSRTLPVLNILLFGKDDVLLRRRKLVEKYEMKPGESRKFEQVVESSPDSVERVVVEIGNPLELKLR